MTKDAAIVCPSSNVSRTCSAEEATDCNGADADGAEAMWHFRWRARLRRYNAPFGSSGNGLDNLSEGLAHILFVCGAICPWLVLLASGVAGYLLPVSAHIIHP